MALPPRQVDFYFDPVSPYVWLATHDLARIEAAGLVVKFVPVLFAGLLKAHGNLGPAEVPAKRNYLFRDVMREAARRGLAFEGPPGHPFNPLSALRMCTAVADEADRRTLALAFVAACWERGEDLMSNVTLVRLADEAGLDGATLLAAAHTAAVKQALADTTARAVADGVFGVPTFRVEGDAELFWGGDRVDALLWRLGCGHQAYVERVDGRAVHPTRDACVTGRVDGFPVHAFKQAGQISSYSGRVRNSANSSESDICSKISAARA